MIFSSQTSQILVHTRFTPTPLFFRCEIWATKNRFLLFVLSTQGAGVLEMCERQSTDRRAGRGMEHCFTYIFDGIDWVGCGLCFCSARYVDPSATFAIGPGLLRSRLPGVGLHRKASLFEAVTIFISWEWASLLVHVYSG